MRIGIVGVLIISMISILNSVTLVFTSDGQYGILKFIGYSALGISFLAELSGFHNLSSFVLTGFMITLMSAYMKSKQGQSIIYLNHDLERRRVDRIDEHGR